MPGHSSVILILAFFMTMATLQYARNYGGRLDEAPALKPSLELAAEDGTTDWILYANGKQFGRAASQVLKTQHGVFTLKQRIILDGDLESYIGPLSMAARSFGITLNDYNAYLSTDMELTYLGAIRNLRVAFVARPRPKIVVPGTPEEKAQATQDPTEKESKANLISLRIQGEVVNNFLVFKGFMEIAGHKFPIDEYKIKHRSQDTFLSNIAPTDCLAYLRPGQRWETPVLDPTAMMFGAFAASKTKDISSQFDPEELIGSKKLAEVYVLDELKLLDWDGQKVRCCVVQSGERGTKMQVWVNASNWRVLKQSIQWQNKSIELIRQAKKEE